MPDISMCADLTCPKRASCYRHRAIPSMYQTYFMKPPRNGAECEYHMPVYSDDRLAPLEEP